MKQFLLKYNFWYYSSNGENDGWTIKGTMLVNAETLEKAIEKLSKELKEELVLGQTVWNKTL